MHILEGEKSPDYSVLITDQILDLREEILELYIEELLSIFLTDISARN